MEKEEKIKKKININKNMAFHILIILCIIIFCISICPKQLQNDTFYTIKLGQLVRENGIDMKDHYSWHEGLSYYYPHWLYDVAMSLIYDYCGGWTGIYISTIVLSIVLGLLIYLTNNKISKNPLISAIFTLLQIYLLKDFIAARAQLVTFILFVLTIFFIEKLLEKKKPIYAIALILIPILIANIHSAVFPFYFVLYLPYIAEYIICGLFDLHILNKCDNIILNIEEKKYNKKLKKEKDQDKILIYSKKIENIEIKRVDLEKRLKAWVKKTQERRKDPYRIKMEKKNNVKWLILIMIICIFTGFLTPIGDMPYTYSIRIYEGNTTKSINEHLPLTLINNKEILISMVAILALLIFTDTKIRLRDLFMIGGLMLLSFISRRQTSMLVLIGAMYFANLVAQFFDKYDPKGSKEFMGYMSTILGYIFTLAFISFISYAFIRGTLKEEYVSKTNYPIEASKYIKENLDLDTIHLFNDYNYGSYLLFEDIPVFIDSRCDLYTPQFNGTKNDDGKWEGEDYFSDYMNVSGISTYYEDKFEKYGISHVITKANSKLKMLLSKDDNYKQLYKDDNFIIFERKSANV